ncbi:hypothetical protein BV372_05135 [Nostoc sp. T09]|uniref:hypothetical protein n=1 Tax=Nostoc sp. T09 TaxID=1932621 RepID=UPI000A3607F0|nr:hypothetical protein [Nostoc sp. T09]OUL37002.1 hypothetical protein BV372_05135 [Nostoc sp. T09]
MIVNCFWKKITISIFIATFAFSCEPTANRRIEQTQVEATEEQKLPQNIGYGDLIIKEQSDYLMIPVTLPERSQEKDSNYSVSRSSGREYKLHNFIFYHKQDGATHLLLNKKAIINSFDFLETKLAAKTPTRFWLYKILEQDTNADKKISFEDAIVGYLSDLSGKNLVQVTPNNTQILNWVIVPSQNALFLKIIKDSNNDKKFTELDKTNFVRVNLDKPSMGTEIISDSIEQETKSYIFK